jgi:hypothetical protein
MNSLAMLPHLGQVNTMPLVLPHDVFAWFFVPAAGCF